MVTPQHWCCWCWCPLCSIIPSFATNIWLGGKFNVPWGAVSVMFSCCRPPADLYSDIYNSSRTSCSCHKMIGMRSSCPTYIYFSFISAQHFRKRSCETLEMVVYWAGVRVMTVCARIKRAGYSLWVAAGCCSVELGINVLFKFCILQTWDRNQNYYDIRPEHRTATGIPDRQLLLRPLQSRKEEIIRHRKRYLYLFKNVIMCPADYIHNVFKILHKSCPSWQIFFKLLRKSSCFPYL